MPTIKELKEQRLHLSEQTNQLVKAEMNAETEAKIDTMHAEWVAMGKNIERLERAEQMDKEMRECQVIPASPIDTHQTKSEPENRNVAYKPIFGKFLRNGANGLSREEAQIMRDFRIEDRALTGASGANGAFLIETDLQKTIREALKSFGGIRQVAEIWETSQGNPVTLPTNNDTANPGKRLNATTTPGTVDELDLTFAQAVFGSWTYTTQKITVSNELLRDAAFDIEKFIRQAFVTRIGRIMNTEFTVGTGTTMPVGLVTGTPAGVTAATGGATSVTYNNLVDLIHSLDPAYRGNAKFMFHDTTLAALRKLVDTQNRPLLGLGINGADPDSVLGYKYQINQDMPVLAASAKSVLFGDFAQAYTVRDVGNLSINRLDELGMLQNSTIFVGFAAADGQYINAGVPASVAFVNSAS